MDTFFTIPLAIVVIYINAVVYGPVNPWPGWSEVHSGFSRVDAIPAVIWREPELLSPWPGGIGWLRFFIIWNQWIYAFCAGMFFAIFGTSRDVFTFYVNVFWRVARVFGWKQKVQSTPDRRRSGIPTTIIFQSAVLTDGAASSTPSILPGERSLS